MERELEGKKIQSIFFPDSPGEKITCSDTVKLILHNDFHGDWDDSWVLVIENGKEIARHNTRYLSSICWEA